MQADLLSANIDFHDDLVRNLPGIRESQNLFDDLSADRVDWEIAIAAESAGRILSAAALITRPFDYGTVISYSFDSSNWQASRFSDASLYGVWYGAPDLETTVYETAWHWYRFVRDSFGGGGRENTTLNRRHAKNSYAVFGVKKKIGGGGPMPRAPVEGRGTHMTNRDTNMPPS